MGQGDHFEKNQAPSEVENKIMSKELSESEIHQELKKYFDDTDFQGQEKNIIALLQENQKLFPNIGSFLTSIKNRLESGDTTVFLEISKGIEREKNKVLDKKDIEAGEPFFSVFIKTETTEAKITDKEAKITDKEAKITDKKSEITDKKSEITDKKSENNTIFQLDKTTQAKTEQQRAEIELKRANIQINLHKTKETQNLLNPDYSNHSSQQIETKLQSLSSETKTKLEENNIDPSTYASFLLSRDSINEASDTSGSSNAFLKSLEALEHSLDIHETGFSKERTPNPRFLEKNPDIEAFVNDDESLKGFDQQLTRERLKTSKDNFAFVKNYGDKKLNALQDQVAPFFDQEGKLKPLNDQEHQLLKDYLVQLSQLKKELSLETAQLFKLSTTHAPIPALMNYLDQQTLGNQPLADLLNGDLPNAIQIKEEQSAVMGKADKVMHIQGTIEGNPITFYYNLSNPTATLQCDDHLHFDSLTNTLSFGEGSGNRTNLNITMPSVAQLSQNLQKFCPLEKMQKLIIGSGDREAYLKNLHSEISGGLDASFSNEKLISSRIGRHTTKNLTVQSFQKALIPDNIAEDLKNSSFLDQHPMTKNFLQLFDATTEKSTSSELQKMRNGLDKLGATLMQPQKIANIKDPLLRSSLQDLHNAYTKKTDFPAWNEAIVSFFSLFSSQEITRTSVQDASLILNSTDFTKLLQFIEKPEELTDNHNLASFSPHFIRNYESQSKAMADFSSIELQLEHAYA